jgi:hypothetical protein
MGKSTISMAIFNSHVKLPEGISPYLLASPGMVLLQTPGLSTLPKHRRTCGTSWELSHPKTSRYSLKQKSPMVLLAIKTINKHHGFLGKTYEHIIELEDGKILTGKPYI